ncbi:anti-sigma factor family protein [Roseomonas populi]|uniref:Anti-sigma factor n=1 Tax=Roseomonas populi TaxID=3121582 RepID=A0ABT1X8S6_9PROT|nr:anti-sigma factor [Roseomonas pecuniae]MCR0983793.1 anti-sigma factor [Roseomonas pecuniae]
MSQRPITEDDLHALVDGLLDSSRQAEVDAYLAEQPAVAARVDAYRRQRAALREALAPVAAEPVPPELNLARLIEARRRPGRVPWQMAAAVVLALGLGGSGGWWLHGRMSPAPAGIAALAQQAAESYAAFVPDRERPVELHAADSATLVRWASTRLGRQVKVPDLSGQGYRLMGGRLVPTTQGAAVMFMFDDDRGSRLVLLTRPMAVDRDTPMAHRDDGTVQAFTWATEGNGYSLVGSLPPATLHPIADEVRQQMRRV